MEENTLYNAIILALVIGIIIVIATLFLARPKPEVFTELYFNEHKTLPDYVTLNQPYNYSFSIVNHEKNDSTYRYTLSQELYTFNYACEESTLYFEKNNQTRIAQSKDARLFVKEQEYNFSLTYKNKAGDGKITISFIDPDDNIKYAFGISEIYQKAYFTTSAPLSKDIRIVPSVQHTLSIKAKNAQLEFYVDNQLLFNKTVTDFTKGYFSITLENSYIDISKTTLDRRNEQQKLFFVYGDSIFNTLNLVKNNDVTTFGITQTGIETAYIAEKPFNLSNYNMEFAFRLSKDNTISFGLDQGFLIIYKDDNTQLTIANGTGKPVTLQLPLTKNSNHRISLDIENNLAHVSVDGDAVTDFNFTPPSIQKPFINTYDTGFNMLSFTIKNPSEPITYNYVVPEKETPSVEYTSILPLSILQNLDDVNTSADERATLMNVLERRKIDWENYRIRASILDPDRNGTLFMTVTDINTTIYALRINSKNNTITINYLQDKQNKSVSKVMNLNTSSVHNIIIQTTKKKMEIIVDTFSVFKEEIDKTGGILLVDHPETLNVIRLQVENPDTKEVTAFRKEANLCTPTLIQKRRDVSTITLPDEVKGNITKKLTFNETFDRAKIQITLDNGQEIHFWVTQT